MAGKAGRSGRRPKFAVMRPAAVDSRQHPASSVPAWQPTKGQLAALGTEGRALIDRFLTVFEFNVMEGEVVLEAAVALDRMAQIRQLRVTATAKELAGFDKTEQAWQKQYASLLAGLRVKP